LGDPEVLVARGSDEDARPAQQRAVVLWSEQPGSLGALAERAGRLAGDEQRLAGPARPRPGGEDAREALLLGVRGVCECGDVALGGRHGLRR
jgi:hypothetical protein